MSRGEYEALLIRRGVGEDASRRMPSGRLGVRGGRRRTAGVGTPGEPPRKGQHSYSLSIPEKDRNEHRWQRFKRWLRGPVSARVASGIFSLIPPTFYRESFHCQLLTPMIPTASPSPEIQRQERTLVTTTVSSFPVKDTRRAILVMGRSFPSLLRTSAPWRAFFNHFSDNFLSSCCYIIKKLESRLRTFKYQNRVSGPTTRYAFLFSFFIPKPFSNLLKIQHRIPYIF